MNELEKKYEELIVYLKALTISHTPNEEYENKLLSEIAALKQQEASISICPQCKSTKTYQYSDKEDQCFKCGYTWKFNESQEVKGLSAEEWMKANYFDAEEGKWLKFDDYVSMEEYAEYYYRIKSKNEGEEDEINPYILGGDELERAIKFRNRQY